MKRSLVLGAVAALLAVAVAVPTLAHRKHEALRDWRDLPQSQRELRVPSAQILDARWPKGTHQILEQSPHLTLLSIDPAPDDYDSEFTGKPIPSFHGHMIFGQTVISDPAEKAALLASFYDGFVTPPDPRGNNKQIGIGCFNPRHGIRATLNGKTVDLLICFGCMQVETYVNDHQLARHSHINEAPSEKFNAILMAAGVPLSPK